MTFSEMLNLYMSRNVATTESGIDVADDGGRAKIAQEHEQHADGENTADDRRVAHFLDRLLDEVRLVEEHGELVTGREFLLPLVEPAHDTARRRHRIGVALLEDGNLDALLAVATA
jgi:hypothetical protein